MSGGRTNLGKRKKKAENKTPWEIFEQGFFSHHSKKEYGSNTACVLINMAVVAPVVRLWTSHHQALAEQGPEPSTAQLYKWGICKSLWITAFSKCANGKGFVAASRAPVLLPEKSSHHLESTRSKELVCRRCGQTDHAVSALQICKRGWGGAPVWSRPTTGSTVVKRNQ